MKSVTYSCHQPNFIPWIGYFNKIALSDYFVILDDVQYVKNSVANRNKIKTSQGESLITVPISKKIDGSSFFAYNMAQISNPDWYKKAFKSLDQNYIKADWYSFYRDKVFEILSSENFCKMNVDFINFIVSEFKLDTQVFLMSELNNIGGKNNDLIISIGKELGANNYLSGQGAKVYNDCEKFKSKSIQLTYQTFIHPTYKQINGSFLPFLSVLDLLFNEGENGSHVVKS